MEKVIQLLEFEKSTLNDLIKYEVADESDLQMIAEIDQVLQLLQSRVSDSFYCQDEHYDKIKQCSNQCITCFSKE